MIEHELLFLGLLATGSKHGYEIKRLIDVQLSPHIGLKIKSIYYPLTQLQKLGLVTAQKSREGKWPEKFVYQLTLKGRKRFDELMSEQLLSMQRPYFEINLSVYFLSLIDRSLAKRKLRARLKLLKRVHKNLINPSQQLLTVPLSLIYNHDLIMVEAEITATERLILSL